MPLSITTISAQFSVCPQISAEDIAQIAQLGFKAIINNRPDLEGGADQPLSADIQAAVEREGMQYFYIPVVPNNIQPQEVAQFVAAFKATQKPVLAFCRTGNRAGKMFELAQAVL